MPRYVAFLRAINVGGAHTVKMTTLCRAFETMGFTEVSSYIASGNILFASPSRSTRTLANRIEEGLMEALGYEVTPFVRTIAELARLAGFQPFPRAKMGAKDQLGILFLSNPLPPGTIRALLALQSATDQFRAAGREIYWLRHRVPGGGVYSTAPFDKVIDQPFTIRSAATVKKLAERFQQHA